MKTWYYAVDVIHWVTALLASHALVGFLAYVAFSSSPGNWIPGLVAACVLFVILGNAIVPLRRFKKQFGFWPGRTMEERTATSSVVINTLRRRAGIVASLAEVSTSMVESIELDAIRVDIAQAEEQLRLALNAASFRYADFGVDRDSTWRTWYQPQSDPIGVGEPVPPSAAAAAVSA